MRKKFSRSEVGKVPWLIAECSNLIEKENRLVVAPDAKQINDHLESLLGRYQTKQKKKFHDQSRYREPKRAKMKTKKNPIS